MKKRIFSLLLTIVMVAALLPTFTLTAEAVDYKPEDVSKVNLRDLETGDVIRKGVTLTTAFHRNLYEVASSTSSVASSRIAILRAGDSWQADHNYYFVRNSGTSVYLYPIPDSPVTFWPNGGSIADGTTGAYTLQCLRFTFDNWNVSNLNPTRPGYTFLGWYTADGATKIYNANGSFVNGTSLWKDGIYQGEGAKSLIAQWQANKYTGKVDPNGGYRATDGSTDIITFERYCDETEEIYERRRTGYTLTGYKVTNSNNDSATDIGGAELTFDNTTKKAALKQGYVPITLIAQWRANTYSVVFNGNGATGGSTATQNFAYDTAQNLRANGFQKKYTVTYEPGEGLATSSAAATAAFAGWNTAANGSGTAYSDQQSVKNLTATDGATINLYAQWTPGSVILPTPTKAGKICTGWYTADGTKVGGCGASYTPTTNTTLYARWETFGYTVTWKNYDGSVLETDEGVAQGAVPTYDGAEPAKPATTEKAYVFSGWSPAISAVTGDVAYTAQFTETPRPYALSFVFDETRGQLSGNSTAPVGSVATVEVLPNNGYVVKDIIAYKTDDPATPVSIDSTSYSFTMPAFDVTVEVTWAQADVIHTRAYKDVAPTFTVTIPAAVTLGSEITVSAENVRVNKGKQVVVSMADAAGAGSAFTMTSAENYSFAYDVTVDGTAVSSGAAVLTVNPDTAHAGSVTLKFEKPNKAIYAGNYSGQVIFTVAVQAAVDP